MRFTLQTRDLGALDVIVSGGGKEKQAFKEHGIHISAEEAGIVRLPAHKLRERMQEYL